MFALIWLTFIGAMLFLAYTLDQMDKPKKSVAPPKPNYADALAKQAKAAEYRKSTSVEDMSLWIEAAARRLIWHWPSVQFTEALRLMREHVAECCGWLGHPDYVWTPETAKEIADEYVNEYGEKYGANA